MKKSLILFLLASFAWAQGPRPKTTARPSEEWVKNGIIYEIYPRAFSPEGTFAEIEKKIPDLNKLGVNILWLMPIHPIGVEKRKGTLGSPYSVKDYYGINPEFGTLDDFRSLVNATHEAGMKIVIDLVANHTAWDNENAKKRTRWYTKNDLGMIVPPVPDWSDVADLNYDNPDLRHYMIEMLKYWVRDIGIDGFRCDVAEMVPTSFWNDARAALDSIKPVMMLAEGQWPEHHLKAFDITYGWNFYHRMANVILGEAHPLSLDSLLTQETIEYPKGSLRMLFSSNHDENAWDNPDVVKFGRNGAKLAAVLVNTFPGIPLLYNGQEVGSAEKLGLFEKHQINWDQGKDFKDFYTRLFAIRKDYPALSEGSYSLIKNNRSKSVFSFLRTLNDTGVLVVINVVGSEQSVQMELPDDLLKKKFTNAFTGKKVDTKQVRKIVLPPKEFRLFVID